MLAFVLPPFTAKPCCRKLCQLSGPIFQSSAHEFLQMPPNHSRNVVQVKHDQQHRPTNWTCICGQWLQLRTWVLDENSSYRKKTTVARIASFENRCAFAQVVCLMLWRDKQRRPEGPTRTHELLSTSSKVVVIISFT